MSAGRRRRVFRDRRVCGWCDAKVVEDEEHFMDGCRKWRKKRRNLWDVMRVGDMEAVKKMELCGRTERVDWMLRGGCSVRTRELLVKGLGVWLFDREKKGRGKNGSERWGERMLMTDRSRIAGVVARRMALALPGLVAAAAKGAAAAALLAWRDAGSKRAVFVC